MSLLTLALAAVHVPDAPPQVFARPNATLQSNGWDPVGAATLHECLDEVSADDDTTFAEAFSVADDQMEVALTTIAPQASQMHQVFTRLRQVSGTSTVQVALYQGLTQIAIQVHGTSNVWATVSFTLSAPEVANITNYADLRIRTLYDNVSIQELRVTQQFLRVT